MHLRVDLAALAEQRTQPLERQRHRAAEHRQRHERGQRQAPVQIEEIRERGDRGHDAAGELHEPGADEVPDPFGVVHDPRQQLTRLGRIEVADRQARDVLLDVTPHVGDRALGRDAEHLRQRERRDRLDEGRGAGDQRQRHQQLRPALAGHIVDQIFGGGWQDEADEAIDQHQRQADADPAPAGPDELARFPPDGGGVELFLLVVVAGSAPTAAAAASDRRPRARSDLGKPSPPLNPIAIQLGPPDVGRDRAEKDPGADGDR